MSDRLKNGGVIKISLVGGFGSASFVREILSLFSSERRLPFGHPIKEKNNAGGYVALPWLLWSKWSFTPANSAAWLKAS